MIIEEIQGDVFDALESRDQDTIFMHGCNMQGHMGAGVAKEVKERWPYVFHEYKRVLNQDFIGLGGVIFSYENSKPLTSVPLLVIANALTQEHWGRNKAHAELGAIEQAIAHVEKAYGNTQTDPDSDAKPFDWNFVAVRVGCGLGGLDWDDVRPLYENSDVDWTIYYL